MERESKIIITELLDEEEKPTTAAPSEAAKRSVASNEVKTEQSEVSNEVRAELKVPSVTTAPLHSNPHSSLCLVIPKPKPFPQSVSERKGCVRFVFKK
jgi:hypothetical protein